MEFTTRGATVRSTRLYRRHVAVSYMVEPVHEYFGLVCITVAINIFLIDRSNENIVQLPSRSRTSCQQRRRN